MHKEAEKLLKAVKDETVKAGPEEGKCLSELSEAYLKKIAKRAPSGDPLLKAYSKTAAALDEIKEASSAASAAASATQDKQIIDFTWLGKPPPKVGTPLTATIHSSTASLLNKHWKHLCIFISIILVFTDKKSTSFVAKGIARVFKMGLGYFHTALEHFFDALWLEFEGDDSLDQGKLLSEIKLALANRGEGDGGPIHVHMNHAQAQLGPLSSLIDRICTVTIGFIMAIAFRQHQQQPA